MMGFHSLAQFQVMNYKRMKEKVKEKRKEKK